MTDLAAMAKGTSEQEAGREQIGTTDQTDWASNHETAAGYTSV